MASRYHFMQGKPSIEERIGTALGAGVGQGLTQLAETKLRGMLTRQESMETRQRLESLGIPAKEADFLSQLPPDQQWDAVRQWWIAGGGAPEALPENIEQDWVLSPEEGTEDETIASQEQPQGPQTAADLVTQPFMSEIMRNALGNIKLEQPQGVMQALQQPMTQAAAPVQQEIAQPPIEVAPKRPKSLGEAYQRTAQDKAKKESKGSKKAALSPDAKIFIENTEKKAELASPLLKELNIIEDYIDAHEDEISTDILSANAPDSFLNTPTKELRRKMSSFLNKLIQIESSGRGSDLLRRIISEGKLNLQQGPEAWREALAELRDEQQDNLRLAELRDEIRKTLGETPDDIAGLARDTLAVEKTEFNALPDSEKISYLFNNPEKMKWITELVDENGKVIARRTKGGWRRVAR